MKKLKEKVDLNEKTNLGIGHTRWATHGIADEINAHPYKVGKFTVVHNGIIENYDIIKKELINKGYIFNSETDTEIIPALLDYLYKENKDILSCIKKLQNILNGSYALGIICDDYPNELFAIKNKSPLIIGLSHNENYIAADVPVILDKTKKYIILDDGDYAKITSDEIEVYNNGIKKEKEVKEFLFDLSSIDKMGYEHFMLKEISYTHSEAYAAGELKHGTISLIENNTPVIAIVTDNDIAQKTISNIKEVKSRGAKVIYITNNNEENQDNFYDIKIIIPKVNDLFQPLLTVIPLQMIAYELAKLKGCNIDKPKNLAKSVTVE